MNQLTDHHIDGVLQLLDPWSSPATSYPRSSVGAAGITTFRYEPGVYHMYGVPGPDGMRYRYYRIDRPILITNLTIGGEVVMVDDPPHWLGMVEHASKLCGHVLCAGLGLGLMAHALAASPAVERITVVERQQDVIDLVRPLVPDGMVEVVRADWYDYRSPHRVDGVLHDLLVGSGMGLLSQAAAALAHARATYPGAAVCVHGFDAGMIGSIAAVYTAMQLPSDELAGHARQDR